ncbi:MAG: acyl-CoA dehydratase activase-related protein [Oscillospiraceae bacterium]
MEDMLIGIPRGMLYYRYQVIFQQFFDALGIKTLVSGPTTHSLAEAGEAVTIDEACLALKLYMGHVQSLLGSCDAVLIPRVCGYGRGREMCPRFHGLYDQVTNVFRGSGQRFLSFNVDGRHGMDEEDAFIDLGESLGRSKKASRQAYLQAKKEDQRQWKQRVARQGALFARDGLKILIAAHSYVVEDEYIGKPILDFLKSSGAVPIRADVADRELALKRSVRLSPTCKWEMSREILGGIDLYWDRVDGIILLSTFPCGPDAMVNELLLRRLAGIPMLNLVLDGQNGTAGLETRLESYLDIIRFKKGEL